MTLKIQNPHTALNKAYLKIKPLRSEIEVFKSNLIHLLDQIDKRETEEFHNNIVSDFLKNSYYYAKHYINTKGRNDLVIHNGKDAKSIVRVIIEAKSTSNKTEMLWQDNINIEL